MGWKSANCAALIDEFRYESACRKVRSDCPMTFVGAFTYWDEDRLDSLMDRGKYAQALVEINKAIELYPNGGNYLFDRGWILENLGKYAEARADYEQAICLGDKLSLNNLAWVLATAPVDEVRDASRAVEIAPARRALERPELHGHPGGGLREQRAIRGRDRHRGEAAGPRKE